jgi:hypothetical protein
MVQEINKTHTGPDSALKKKMRVVVCTSKRFFLAEVALHGDNWIPTISSALIQPYHVREQLDKGLSYTRLVVCLVSIVLDAPIREHAKTPIPTSVSLLPASNRQRTPVEIHTFLPKKAAKGCYSRIARAHTGTNTVSRSRNI